MDTIDLLLKDALAGKDNPLEQMLEDELTYLRTGCRPGEDEAALVLMDEDARDDKVIFDAEHFFDELKNVVYSDEDVDPVDALKTFDAYIPRVMDALRLIGEDTEIAYLYAEWMEFASDHTNGNNELIEKIINEACKLLTDENIGTYPDMSFRIFETAIESLEDKTVIAPRVEKTVIDFILDHAAPVLKGYVAIEHDGLDKSDPGINLIDDVHGYESYDARAATAYDRCIRIMKSCKDREAALELVYPLQADLMKIALSHSMGELPFDKNGCSEEPNFWPNIETPLKLFASGAKALQHKDDRDKLNQYISLRLPLLLEQAFHANRPDLHAEAVVKSLKLYKGGKNLSHKKERKDFIVETGSRAVTTLVKMGHVNDAVTVMRAMHEQLGLNRSNVMVVTDPSCPDAKMPVALFSGYKPRNGIERRKGDLAAFFQESARDMTLEEIPSSSHCVAQYLVNGHNIIDKKYHSARNGPVHIPREEESKVDRRMNSILNMVQSKDFYQDSKVVSNYIHIQDRPYFS